MNVTHVIWSILSTLVKTQDRGFPPSGTEEYLNDANNSRKKTHERKIKTCHEVT